MRGTLKRLKLPALLAGVYGIFITMALALRLLVGEQWPIVAWLNNGLHLWMIPALMLLPVCLLMRRWRLAMLMVPAVVTFVTAYAIFFIPRPVNIPDGAAQIRLLTYNLQAEETLLDPMIEIIRTSQADIVALQELSVVMVERLDTEVVDIYPYRGLHPTPHGPYWGRGILSRYPIVTDQSWPVEFPIPVRLQRTEIDIDDTPIVLYNMHAPPTYPIFGEPYDVGPRKQQITDLLESAGQDTGAVVLVGDFNTTDLDENYARITAQYRDTYREVGSGMGFTNPDWQHDNQRRGPSFIPMYHRIDYVFHNDALQAVEARVWPSSGGSDHRPLYVVLALEAELD